MAYELKRASGQQRGLWFRTVSYFATGAYLIWSEVTEGSLSVLWIGAGALLWAWAGLTLYYALRPVQMRVTEAGVFAQTGLGTHRFDWPALKWVDFTRPAKSAILCYSLGANTGANTKDKFIVLTPRATTDANRDDILRAILAFRPDVPLANPEPFVELWS